jgi:hypothetical protein
LHPLLSLRIVSSSPRSTSRFEREKKNRRHRPLCRLREGGVSSAAPFQHGEEVPLTYCRGSRVTARGDHAAVPSPHVRGSRSPAWRTPAVLLACCPRVCAEAPSGQRPCWAIAQGRGGSCDGAKKRGLHGSLAAASRSSCSRRLPL